MKKKPQKEIPKTIPDTIQSKGSVVLLTHSHPDGDAIGSLLGLAEILLGMGKKVFCFLEEPVSHLYNFLPGIDNTCTDLVSYHLFVKESGDDLLIIALDCGDEDRLGRFKKEFLSVRPFIVIDHHKSHQNFGNIRWVDSGRSSTGEMVYELGRQLQAPMSYSVAYNLYVAICTDTGSFRYDCTTARTMEIGGDLIALGVQPAEVGNRLFENFSRQRLKLLELALSTIEMSMDERAAFMYVSQNMLQKSGAVMDDVEGFIDYPRSVASVKVAVLLKETDKDATSVSMRAKGDCDLAEVAKQFGGGGHRNAAGFKIFGKSLEQVREELAPVIKQAMCD